MIRSMSLETSARETVNRNSSESLGAISSLSLPLSLVNQLYLEGRVTRCYYDQPCMHVCRGRNDSTLIVHSEEKKKKKKKQSTRCTGGEVEEVFQSVTYFVRHQSDNDTCLPKERLLLFSLHVRIND